MKKQFLTFALSIAILLGGAIPAYALDNNMVGTHTITRASQYLDGYSVGIEARGNGKIAVAMTVDGTGIMEKIGVAEVEIEYKTNGVWRYYDSPVSYTHLDYKRDGEKETDFIDVVAWRSTAEFVSRYFAKGRMAVVEGRLQIRDWTDKEGGKRRSAEVIADNVYFGDSKPKEDGAPSADADFGAPPSGFTPDFGDDGEMPF